MKPIQDGKKRAVNQLMAALAVAAMPAVSWGTTYTWNGSTTTGFGYFIENDNWVGNAAPPTNGADIIFGSINTHGYQPTMSQAYSFNSLQFNSSALSYNIAGSPYVMSLGAGSIKDSASVAESFTGPVLLTAGQNWTDGSAPFTLNGNLNMSSFGMNITTSSSVTFNGLVNGSAGSSINPMGTGTLIFAGSGTSSFPILFGNANVAVTAGTLKLTSTVSPFFVSSFMNVSSGATLDASADTSVSNGEVIDGTSTTALNVIGSTSKFLGGANVYFGDQARGTLSVNAGKASTGGFFWIGHQSGSVGTASITNGGNLTAFGLVVAGLSGSIGNVTESGTGTTMNVSGTMYVSDGGTGNVTITNNAQASAAYTDFFGVGTLNVSGGTLVTGGLNNSGTFGLVTLTDGSNPALTLNASTGNDNSYSGTISGTGTIVKTGGSQQVLSGSCTVGTLNVQAGIINVSGGSLTTAGITSSGYSTGNIYLAQLIPVPLTINGSSGSYTYSGSISGAGTLGKLGASQQVFTGNCTVGALFVSGGTLNVSSGTFAVTSSTIQSGVENGLLLVSNGGTLDLSGTGNSIFLIDGEGSDSPVITVTGTGSKLNLSPAFAVGYSGLGTLNVQQNATVVSTGTASSGVYGLYLGYTSTGSGKLAISSGGSLTNLNLYVGYANGSTGIVTVDGASSTLNIGTLNIVGSSNGVAKVTATNGGIVNVSNAIFDSQFATFNANGGSLVANTLDSGTSGSGNILLTDPAVGAALTLNTSSGSYFYNGLISGSGSILKLGSGTQVLAGSNTFTGVVQVYNGALEMSSGAATLYDATVGTLQLDFGSYGSGTLEADASATVILNTTRVSGGYLYGPGTFNLSNVSFYSGTTIEGGTSVTLANGAQLSGFTNAGTISVPSANNITWLSGSNAGGTFNISGTAYVGGWTSTGITQINPGGQLVPANFNSQLLGGSRTYVGTSTNPGGTISMSGGAALQLSGGLLVNYGSVSGGTVYVNYAGLATGTGSYSSVVVTPGGTYLPGNYGVNSPPPNLGSPFANIQPATSGSTTTATPITVTTSALIAVNTGDLLTLSGGLTATGQSVTLTGGGTAAVQPFSATSVNVSNGTLQMLPSTTVLSVSAVTIGSTGKLDLSSDDADISNQSLGTINTYAQLGFAHGTWNGSGGITSSTAAADTNHLTAIGVIQNNQSGTALFTASHLFEGTVPGPADVLAKYTYFGDANLDGKVDGSDYTRIDSAFLLDKSNATAATGWFNGDFNYDGVVNGSDYTLIDNAFNRQGAQLTAETASATAQLATSAVPEPGSISVALLGTAVLLGRRRSRV